MSALKSSAYRQNQETILVLYHTLTTHRAVPPYFASASAPPPILAMPYRQPVLSEPRASPRRSCPGARRALGRSLRSSAPGVPGGTRTRRRRSPAVFEVRRRPSGSTRNIPWLYSSLLACKVTKQTTATDGHQELDSPKGEANRWQKPKVITVTNEDSATVSEN
jgi:hypothetical protein